MATKVGTRGWNAVADRVGRIDWQFVRQSTQWLVPLGFAALSLIVVLKYVLTPQWLGLDASLYSAASAAWLAGDDPWAVREFNTYFAAPPPTLIAFVPFTWMPPLMASIVWIVGSFALIVAAVRSLHVPIWWIAFPPLVDAALVGNPDAAVLALLVIGRGRLSFLAPFLKIYAVVPMIGERRWRQLIITGSLLIFTASILPWGFWLRSLPTINLHLAEASQTTSVYGLPVLMAVGVVALLSLGLRRAGWLAVPLLWPHSQFHYGAIAVPGLTPFLALAWCFPAPEVWLASTVALAVHQRFVTHLPSKPLVPA